MSFFGAFLGRSLAVLAVVFQLFWPAVQAIHEFLEQDAPAITASLDTSRETDRHPAHHHDAANCNVCRTIAQLRTIELPQAQPVVVELTPSLRCAFVPQSNPVIASPLTRAAPRGPPVV